jgi:hypothetical protein
MGNRFGIVMDAPRAEIIFEARNGVSGRFCPPDCCAPFQPRPAVNRMRSREKGGTIWTDYARENSNG